MYKVHREHSPVTVLLNFVERLVGYIFLIWDIYLNWLYSGTSLLRTSGHLSIYNQNTHCLLSQLHRGVQNNL